MDNPPVLDNYDAIKDELSAYRQQGGGAQIDCQPGGAGRDGRKLRDLSRESDVKIVACTGFHLEGYYPRQAPIWNMNSDQAREYFLEEIRLGLEETRDAEVVYPGLIKIAGLGSLEESPLHLFDAAVEAAKETDLAIEMHTEKGQDLERFAEYFSKQGISPGKVVFCHVDKRPDKSLHQEMAEAGFLLEYDTFFRPKYQPEKHLWPLIEEMVADGYEKALVLATDQADPMMWSEMGTGPGLPGLIKVIKKRLDEVIQEPGIVQDLIGRNISRCLAVG